MLIIFGLDGATFDLLDPWLEAGDLPHLRNLVKRGVRGSLESTLPPLTAPAWASFMTGKSPVSHGIWDFFRLGSSGIQFVDHTHIDASVFWRYLTEAGKKSAILNVPLTHPPQPLKGILVAGLLSPAGSPTTYPPGLLDPLQDELGSYQPVPQALYWPGREAQFIAALREFTRRQILFARRLIEEQAPDVAVVHFLATDIAQHKLWKHLDPGHPWHRPSKARPVVEGVLSLYQEIDEAMGQIIEQAGPASNVIVMSDHGFGPVEKTVNLNMLFLEHGLLETRASSGVRLRHWLADRPLTAQLARRALRFTGGGELLPISDIDWERTQAFSLGHCGQIYVNLRGRQPKGSVPVDAYKAVIHLLQRALGDLPMPVEIIGGMPGDTGSVPADGPDLHVVLDGYRAVAHPLLASNRKIVTEIRHGDSGFHRINGMFVGSGPAFRVAHRITSARIIDMAPTILYLAGNPVPADMDGSVLKQAIKPDHLARNPIRTREPLPKWPGEIAKTGAESDLQARLRSLGYLQ